MAGKKELEIKDFGQKLTAVELLMKGFIGETKDNLSYQQANDIYQSSFGILNEINRLRLMLPNVPQNEQKNFNLLVESIFKQESVSNSKNTALITNFTGSSSATLAAKTLEDVAKSIIAIEKAKESAYKQSSKPGDFDNSKLEQAEKYLRIASSILKESDFDAVPPKLNIRENTGKLVSVNSEDMIGLFNNAMELSKESFNEFPEKAKAMEEKVNKLKLELDNAAQLVLPDIVIQAINNGIIKVNPRSNYDTDLGAIRLGQVDPNAPPNTPAPVIYDPKWAEPYKKLIQNYLAADHMLNKSNEIIKGYKDDPDSMQISSFLTLQEYTENAVVISRDISDEAESFTKGDADEANLRKAIVKSTFESQLQRLYKQFGHYSDAEKKHTQPYDYNDERGNTIKVGEKELNRRLFYVALRNALIEDANAAARYGLNANDRQSYVEILQEKIQSSNIIEGQTQQGTGITDEFDLKAYLQQKGAIQIYHGGPYIVRQEDGAICITVDPGKFKTESEKMETARDAARAALTAFPETIEIHGEDIEIVKQIYIEITAQQQLDLEHVNKAKEIGVELKPMYNQDVVITNKKLSGDIVKSPKVQEAIKARVKELQGLQQRAVKAVHSDKQGKQVVHSPQYYQKEISKEFAKSRDDSNAGIIGKALEKQKKGAEKDPTKAKTQIHPPKV